MSKPFLNCMQNSKITKNNIIICLVPLLRDNPSSRRPTWLVLRLTVPTEKTINVNQYEEKIKQTYNYYIFLVFGSIYCLFTPFSKIFLGLNRGRGWGKDISKEKCTCFPIFFARRVSWHHCYMRSKYNIMHFVKHQNYNMYRIITNDFRTEAIFFFHR